MNRNHAGNVSGIWYLFVGGDTPVSVRAVFDADVSVAAYDEPMRYDGAGCLRLQSVGVEYYKHHRRDEDHEKHQSHESPAEVMQSYCQGYQDDGGVARAIPHIFIQRPSRWRTMALTGTLK